MNFYPSSLEVLLLVILPVAFVVGLVLLSIKGGWVGRIIAATVALLIFAPLVMILSMRLVTPQSVTQQPRSARADGVSEPSDPRTVPFVQTPTASTTAIASPARWQPATDLLSDATADLHPSRQEAEADLAAQLMRSYSTGKPLHITLIDKSVTSPEKTHRGLAQALRQRGVACDFNDTVRGASSLHTLAYVNVTSTPPTDGHSIGTVTATASNTNDLQARYVDKPWLTDLTAHRINTQNPDLVIALHGELQSTEADARADALRVAADLIAPRLVRIRDGKPHHPHRSALQYALNQDWPSADRFTQRLDRPYGSVYRTALLLDLSHEPLQRLAQSITAWTNQPSTPSATSFIVSRNTDSEISAINFGHTATSHITSAHHPVASNRFGDSYASIFFRLLGLGVLVGLTLLIYTGLDRWTRGYRPVAVSTTAIVLVLGGAALLGLLAIA